VPHFGIPLSIKEWSRRELGDRADDANAVN